MTESDRISAPAEYATILVSHPLYDPARASISGIRMTPISGLSPSRPLGTFNGVLAPGIAFEKTFVPRDYALSFNFTLLKFGASNTAMGVIQYTNDSYGSSHTPSMMCRY